MMHDDAKQCVVCLQPFLDRAEPTCSERCEQGDLASVELGNSLVELAKSTDTRVFFYDVGFGDLVDRFTVLVLRRLHQKSLREHIETDFHLGRVKMAIETKINRLAHDPAKRLNIAACISRLYRINAIMWRLRSRAMAERLLPEDVRQRAALAYQEWTGERDKLRQDLDLTVDGRSRTVRVYSQPTA